MVGRWGVSCGGNSDIRYLWNVDAVARKGSSGVLAAGRSARKSNFGSLQSVKEGEREENNEHVGEEEVSQLQPRRG